MKLRDSQYCNTQKLIDFFVKYKEEHGDEASSLSNEKVEAAKNLFEEQLKQFSEMLEKESAFYSLTGNTYQEALQRVSVFKRCC